MANEYDVLSKMEEARINDSEQEEKINIVIDIQLSIREKAIMNTKLLIPKVKPSRFCKEQIFETCEKLTKCNKCYCDMEKDIDLKDIDDNYYYCSLCWEDWDGENVLAPLFIEEWGYEYEKVEIDY